MNNFISTNRKDVEFCFSPPIGPNKIVQQENKITLDEIVVSLFNCFQNPLPEKESWINPFHFFEDFVEFTQF